jgi:hypothetical protein
MKLVKTRVKKLIAALRSGKYKQTTGTLREKRGLQMKYCCLGVACDVYRKETGKGKWKRDGGCFDFCVDENLSEGDLIMPVWTWYGLGSQNPKINGETAIVRNDSLKETFDQIADALEADLKK